MGGALGFDTSMLSHLFGAFFVVYRRHGHRINIPTRVDWWTCQQPICGAPMVFHICIRDSVLWLFGKVVFGVQSLLRFPYYTFMLGASKRFRHDS